MSAQFEAGQPEHFEPQRGDFFIVASRMIWRRHWLLALGAVVGCIIAALQYARSVPIYQSSAQILVMNKSSHDALPMATASGSGMEGVSLADYLSTHMILLHSRTIVGAAVQQARLGSLPSFAQNRDPIGTIISSLKVAQEMNNGAPTNVLTLSLQSTHAEDIPVVLNAIIEGYQHFLSDRYKSGTNETAKLVVDANEILEQKIFKKQKEYEEFLAQQPPVLWRGKDGLNAVQARLSNLETELSALRRQERKTRGRISTLEKALKDGNHSEAELLALLAQTPERSGGKETSGILAMEDRLMDLELQEKTLLKDYGPDHPQVLEVRDRLALHRARIKRSSDSGNNDSTGVALAKARLWSLQLELENTQTEAEAVEKMLQGEHLKAKPLRDFEQKLESYRTDIIRSQQLFDATAKRLDEISILKNFTGGYEAEIIDPPMVGGQVAPNASRIFAMGLVLGLLGGFGLAYLAELADQSFRTPEEIRRQLGLPVVGHIPFIGLGEEKKPSPADGLLVDPIVCTAHRPKSCEAEAYRGVRTSLFFNREKGHSVIQITSPEGSDGKSVLAANLAVSIAQAEKKVILIDGDFRRPRVHKLFQISADRGLAQVMSREAELNEVIQTTSISGLSVLPCGSIPPNPAELLTMPRFKEVLANLRERFDFVLVDTPPLLAVTDPCVIVPHMDGVVLVVRLSKKVRPRAVQAKEILSSLAGRVIGVVVNGVGKGAKGYGYSGYRYSYNYHYTNYSDPDYDSPEAGEEVGAAANGAVGKLEKQLSVSRRSSRTKKRLVTWLFKR